MKEFISLEDIMREIAPDTVKGLSEDERLTLRFMDSFDNYIYATDGASVSVYDSVCGEKSDLIGFLPVSDFIAQTVEEIRDTI